MNYFADHFFLGDHFPEGASSFEAKEKALQAQVKLKAEVQKHSSATSDFV